ncbi:MAG: hypothetical protein ABI397_03615 [Candidatus Saccharimonas sp.]
MRKKLAITISISAGFTAIVGAIFFLPLLTASASNDSYAHYDIAYQSGDNWVGFGTEVFSTFPKNVTFTLPAGAIIDGSSTIRISKIGGGLGFADYLAVDGQAAKTGDKLADKKLKSADLDVTGIPADKPLVATFSNLTNGKVSFKANIEAKTVIGMPFALDGTRKLSSFTPTGNYTIGASNGTVINDGIAHNYPLTKTYAQFKTHSISGHPDGTAYIWVFNDDKNVYFVADWTSDNTFDKGSDFFRVHLDDGTGVKNIAEHSDIRKGENGQAIFAYTDNAVYQHMYYTIPVPLSQLKSDSLKIGFELYGTASAGPVLCGPFSGGAPV